MNSKIFSRKKRGLLKTCNIYIDITYHKLSYLLKIKDVLGMYMEINTYAELYSNVTVCTFCVIMYRLYRSQ